MESKKKKRIDPTPKSVLALERATSSSPMGRHCLPESWPCPSPSRMVTGFCGTGAARTNADRKTAGRGVQRMTRWMTSDRKVKIAKGEGAHFNDLGEKKAFLYPRETQALETYSCSRHKNRCPEDSYRGDVH